jgi:hypothetical protein
MEGVTIVEPSEIRDTFLAALSTFEGNQLGTKRRFPGFTPNASNWGRVQRKLGVEGVVNKIFNGESVDLSRVPVTHRARVRYALEAAGLTEYALSLVDKSYYGNIPTTQTANVSMERPERDYIF